MTWISPAAPPITYWEFHDPTLYGARSACEYIIGGIPVGKNVDQLYWMVLNKDSEFQNVFWVGLQFPATINGVTSVISSASVPMSIMNKTFRIPNVTLDTVATIFSTGHWEIRYTDASIDNSPLMGLPPASGPYIGNVYPKPINPVQNNVPRPVTITGTNFGTNPSIVPGGPNAPGILGDPGTVSIKNTDTQEVTPIGVTTWTNGQITFDLPEGLPPGIYEITVVNPWGQSITYTITIGEGSLISFDIIAVKTIV